MIICSFVPEANGKKYMTDLIQNWLTAWNSHDTAKLLELYNESFGNEVVSENHSFHDSQSFIDMGQRIFRAFPDLFFDITESVEERDKIAILWLAHATHIGRYNNIPPTGKKLDISGTTFFELRNGKISKAVFLWDGADMLRQMGLLPELQAA
jgi:steroid delta-isomerase-like uncharacterized protein